MAQKPPRPNQPVSLPLQPGRTARAAGRTLNSCTIGVLPILDRFFHRLRLKSILHDHLPREDRRSRIPTATGLLLLLKNLLISREPLYGIGEWAARQVPDCLGLLPAQLPSLNDDRIGRCLDRLFSADIPTLALAVVVHAVREFGVDLDELHNDSTTITLHGDYETADRERTLRGRLRLAVIWGHNKDHRPDLKQLLYILTVTRDGAVPVQFRVQSGNTTDDRSHRATWDLLCKLTGRRDFLYVADCKLATAENLAYIHQHGGRFLSVLPRTRGEDAAFRAEILQGRIDWRWIHDKYDDDGELVDQFSIHEPEATSIEGYRLIWYHSTRKAELDALARQQRIERALRRLTELRAKLASPRTRHRERAKVAKAVEAILRETGTEGEIEVTIEERTEETFHQGGRGRPNAKTLYLKRERIRFDLTIRVDHARLAEEARCDGIFPLITNEVTTAKDLLLAYKQQPMIEKRFSQLKTDFVVAPVFLKEVSRIQALLCVYFLALLVESLLERELRRAMERELIESLPLYPEGRACRRPTARKVIDLFEDVQRHELSAGRQRPPVVFTTKLSRLQRRILRLLGMKKIYDI
jgi:transposase